MLCPLFPTWHHPLLFHGARLSIPMKSRLTQEEIANEASNHLARRQTAAAGFAFQRHCLVARQEHGQLDHVGIQRTDLLSLGFLLLGWLRLHAIPLNQSASRLSPR